jgi:hypothetical protein
VFANSVSGAELMQQAQKQGLQVAGFGTPGFTHGGPSFAPPVSATPPNFGTAGGFAPQPAGNATGFHSSAPANPFGAPSTFPPR